MLTLIFNRAGAAAPSFTLSPTQGYALHSINVVATGENTAWTNSTSFLSSSPEISHIVTNSINVALQTANLTIVSTSLLGTATIGDNTDSATAPFTIVSAVFQRRSLDQYGARVGTRLARAGTGGL